MSAIDHNLRRDLRYAAARFFLGDLRAGDAIRSIEGAMNTGLWRDDFFAILDSEPILREVTEPFRRCLDALGVAVDGYEEALLAIVDWHTHVIVSGKEVCLQSLFRDLGSFDFSISWDRRLLDANDASMLWDLYQESSAFLFDDSDPPPPDRDKVCQAYRLSILQEAVRWQKARGGL